MIPCIGATVGGITYYPLYNNQAMFRMQDSYPGDVLDQLKENSKASFQLAFDIFRLLCEEGEAVRKFYGYEPGQLPDWETAEQTYSPSDTMTMKTAIYAAVTLGCTREFDAEEEVDLILLELKKTNE